MKMEKSTKFAQNQPFVTFSFFVTKKLKTQTLIKTRLNSKKLLSLMFSKIFN